jgi:hypothetical protein
MRGKTSSALVQEGDDTVPAATVWRTGMWLGTVEAKDIAWTREPNLTIPGKQFTSIEVPKQADQAESHIVFIAMNLGDGICIDLQGAPNDTIGHGIQCGQRHVDLATQFFHASLSGSSCDFGSVEVIRGA